MRRGGGNAVIGELLTLFLKITLNFHEGRTREMLHEPPLEILFAHLRGASETLAVVYVFILCVFMHIYVWKHVCHMSNSSFRPPCSKSTRWGRWGLTSDVQKSAYTTNTSVVCRIPHEYVQPSPRLFVGSRFHSFFGWLECSVSQPFSGNAVLGILPVGLCSVHVRLAKLESNLFHFLIPRGKGPDPQMSRQGFCIPSVQLFASPNNLQRQCSDLGLLSYISLRDSHGV